MKNVLVTGGAGFIGSNFIRFLQTVEKEVTVINLDALTYAGSLENLKDLPAPDRHIFVQGDICNREHVDALLRQYRIDTIVHFAAETHVDRSILGPGQFIQTNIVGTYTLLESARQYWMTGIGSSEGGSDNPDRPEGPFRFHHISTDEVFGSLDMDSPAWTEETPYAPNSPYAASKASSDHLVRAYHHTYGMPCTISNCSNNYGPLQFPEKLIPLMILNGMTGKPLPVYGDGQQIRDWLYVEDHCEAIWLVLRKGRVGETYNIGGGAQPTNIVVVEQLCGILDELIPESPYTPHRSLIKYVTDRPGHDRRYAIDYSKAQRELGWNPRQSLGSGMQKTVAWYLAHPDWIAAVQGQGDYKTWIQRNYTQRSVEKPGSAS